MDDDIFGVMDGHVISIDPLGDKLGRVEVSIRLENEKILKLIPNNWQERNLYADLLSTQETFDVTLAPK